VAGYVANVITLLAMSGLTYLIIPAVRIIRGFPES
jgi:hypothetical protein